MKNNKVVTSDEERIEAEIARTQTSSQDIAVDKFVTAGQAVQSEKKGQCQIRLVMPNQ
ncbi:hypothetical protein QW180_04160 [Vibrio sinaloensis]|nr:hypothetical protein [Vibrio sinaloensis]